MQSIDHFGAAILDDNDDAADPTDTMEDDTSQASFYASVTDRVILTCRFQFGLLHSRSVGMGFRGASSTHTEDFHFDSRKVVNVIIAKDFNFAHEDVQIQTLEV